MCGNEPSQYCTYTAHVPYCQETNPRNLIKACVAKISVNGGGGYGAGGWPTHQSLHSFRAGPPAGRWLVRLHGRIGQVHLSGHRPVLDTADSWRTGAVAAQSLASAGREKGGLSQYALNEFNFLLRKKMAPPRWAGSRTPVPPAEERRPAQSRRSTDER